MFKWVSSYLFRSKIQILHFLLHWSIRTFRFNLIREISTWKITDAIAAGYCFSSCFLAEPLLKELLLFWTKLLCIYPFLFKKKSQEREIIVASMEISHQFLALKVPIFRRNKITLPTPVLLTIHFSIAMTTLVLGNLVTLFRFATSLDDCHIFLHLYCQVANFLTSKLQT